MCQFHKFIQETIVMRQSSETNYAIFPVKEFEKEKNSKKIYFYAPNNIKLNSQWILDVTVATVGHHI